MLKELFSKTIETLSESFFMPIGTA